ncbi:hypothetical protein B7486_02280 [cyanobacterium TDX16]|nr:hypothetical protein B7486_02280 [cyanobacterium TDX16]
MGVQSFGGTPYLLIDHRRPQKQSPRRIAGGSVLFPEAVFGIRIRQLECAKTVWIIEPGSRFFCSRNSAIC